MSILRDFVQSVIPLIWVKSLEEDRFILEEVASLLPQKIKNKIYIHDATNILYDVEESEINGIAQKIETDGGAFEAIDKFIQEPEGNYDAFVTDGVSSWDITQHGFPRQSMLVLLDAPFQMVDERKVKHTNARLTRKIKSSISELIKQDKTLVIVNHHEDVPIELEYLVTYVEHELPNVNSLKRVVKGSMKSLKTAGCPVIDLSNEELDKVAQQLKGLTKWQAENVLSIANRENALDFVRKETTHRTFKSDVIRNEKARLTKKSSTLEVIEPEYGMDDVGGMGRLKQWAEDRFICFSPEAREDGADIPKGILTVGPGGVGKSYVALALAKQWDRTVLRLDLAACMGGLLGQSEGNLIKALKDAEAQAPCILFVDEFEKLFAGATGFQGDGGTFQRMYGTWLTWTQFRKADVFVVATTNNVQTIPAPAIRKGRFDEIFYVHLPSVNERADIFRIHLKKRGWDPDEYGIDLKTLAVKTPKRTGSEIKEIIAESIIQKIKTVGFGRSNPLTTQHVLDSIERVKIMAELRPEEANDLLAWAKERDVMMASDEYIQEEKQSKGAKPRSKIGSLDSVRKMELNLEDI